jgi:hypothetical protein
VNPTVGLDDMEERKFLTLLGLELRSLARPVRSQSLYRVRYPDSSVYETFLENKQLHALLNCEMTNLMQTESVLT